MTDSTHDTESAQALQALGLQVDFIDHLEGAQLLLSQGLCVLSLLMDTNEGQSDAIGAAVNLLRQADASLDRAFEASPPRILPPLPPTNGQGVTQ